MKRAKRRVVNGWTIINVDGGDVFQARLWGTKLLATAARDAVDLDPTYWRCVRATITYEIEGKTP